MLRIKNVSVLTPQRMLENAQVVLDGAKIKSVEVEPEIVDKNDSTLLDGEGNYLVPGFIDMQINGGFGWDFTEQPDTIWKVGNQLPKYGVTSFLPTMITAPLEKYSQAQDILQSGLPQDCTGSNVLGLHIEGPFLNPEKRGAHDPRFMRSPNLKDVDGWSMGNGVMMVTLAPELEGAQEMISHLVERGIIVSAGHTLANFDETQKAIAGGLRYGTHLFNAMRPLHHREPGVAGALLTNENVIVGIIPDGIHIHPALLESIYHLVAPQRLNLVSDAMAGLGMSSGVYKLGPNSVHVSGGEACLEDGSLAGSVLSLDQGLRNLIDFADCSLQDALHTVTTTPARLLGLSHQKGQIAPGYDADLVLLSHDLQVLATVVNGRMVYQRDYEGN
ncbi:MAG: N-acetylglucosamine-6-phosphate deacetylase [Chloroflexi bacterium]|nr:N-acetylglucosamine-6-phosphate deacetylase [Chloroflexota bacterium]